MKRAILAVVLIACFVTAALAQDRQPATVGEYSGLSQVRDDGVHSASVVRCANVTGYYYYSGNFDSTNQYATGLANEADTQVADSHVYQPFLVVPPGTEKYLDVTGLCVNSLDTSGAGIDNPTPYEVRVNIKEGLGGILVCKGKATSSDDPTGRTGFGITEYTHAVKVRKCKLAGSGKNETPYYMNVTPQCFKNTVCNNARYFESTDDSNLDHIGPPTNRRMYAFWKSFTFRINWSLACEPECVGERKSFSVGVTGRLVK